MTTFLVQFGADCWYPALAQIFRFSEKIYSCFLCLFIQNYTRNHVIACLGGLGGGGNLNFKFNP